MPTSPPGALVIATLVLVQVLFGLNYVFSKVVVGQFPPLVWGQLRLVFSAVVMIAVALGARRPFPRDGRSFFGPLAVFAFFGIIINQACFLVGLSYTTATNSAILNTLIPVFTLLIVTLRGQERLTPARAIGFVFAFSGVLILRHIENFQLSDSTLVGDLLTIVNCLSFAVFLATSKGFMQAHDRFWSTAFMFIYGVVGFSLLSVPSWSSGFAWPELTPVLLGSMAFAIIGGTLLTYFLQLWALAHARSSSVALFIYLQPVVASVFAWAWKGEAITLRTVLASTLIFVGMVLASLQNLARPRAQS